MNLKGGKRKFTDEMVDFVKSHVKEKTDKQIAALLSDKYNMHITESSITNLKVRYGIKSGVRRGTFPKGHIPVNKGTKGMFNVGGNKTSFKSGMVPINHRPVGSERVDSKDGYILVKVAEPNVWRAKHRVLWEQVNGPIPAKHRLVFLNGNREDVRIENLVLMTYGESAVMNRLDLFDSNSEITKVGVSIAKLVTKTSKKAIKERSKD